MSVVRFARYHVGCQACWAPLCSRDSNPGVAHHPVIQLLATLALTAAALHEMVGFGLQTPLNRLLLASWIGLILGLAPTIDRIIRHRTHTQAARDDPAEERSGPVGGRSDK